MMWRMKETFALIATPILLVPLLILFPQHQAEAKCGYCIILMMIYWVTEALPLAITALLPMVLFPVFGLIKSEDVAKLYLPDTSFLFMGGLLIAVAVERSQLHRRVALFTLTIVGSQPKWIMFGFMTVTAFLSMWISNTATTAMMVPIVQSVIVELVRTHRGDGGKQHQNLIIDEQLKKRDNKKKKPIDFEDFTGTELRMAKGMLISICFGANIGGCGTITGTPPNLVLLGQIDKLYPNAETGINFLSWMAFSIPMVIVCLVLCWLILLFVFIRHSPCHDRQLAIQMKQKYQALPPISFAEKAVILCFALVLTMWIFRDPKIIPGFGMLFLDGFVTDATCAVLIAIVLFAIPNQNPGHKNGTLLDWASVQEKFPWNVILLLGGGFALAAGVKESHLSLRIGEVLHTLHIFPEWAILTICVMVTVILTNICSNTVTASIFIPIVAELASSLNINPLLLMIPVATASSLAFVLPVATPPNAIIFASGLLSVFDMILAGLLTSVVCSIVLIVNMQFYTRRLLNLNDFPEWAREFELTTVTYASAGTLFNTTMSD